MSASTPHGRLQIVAGFALLAAALGAAGLFGAGRIQEKQARMRLRQASVDRQTRHDLLLREAERSFRGWAGASALTEALDSGLMADRDRSTLLYDALYRGNRKAAETILRRPPPAAGLNDPLALACERNDAEMARRLIRLGASAIFVPKDGMTALHYAANSPENECVALLLRLGASPDVQADEAHEHVTPLMLAAGCGDDRNVRLLLAHSANPSLRDTRGRTYQQFSGLSKGAKRPRS